jgi:hypothetical protein
LALLIKFVVYTGILPETLDEAGLADVMGNKIASNRFINLN